MLEGFQYNEDIRELYRRANYTSECAEEHCRESLMGEDFLIPIYAGETCQVCKQIKGFGHIRISAWDDIKCLDCILGL